jgi:hypothetical protein
MTQQTISLAQIDSAIRLSAPHFTPANKSWFSEIKWLFFHGQAETVITELDHRLSSLAVFVLDKIICREKKEILSESVWTSYRNTWLAVAMAEHECHELTFL